MPHLSNFLFPQSILLSLEATEQESALQEILNLLQNDERVSRWPELIDSILSRPVVPLEVDDKIAILIYHGRTSYLKELLIAVGRNKKGILLKEGNTLAHLIFVIAVPHTLNNEYLRIMGSIARVCKDPFTLEKLFSAKSEEEFIEILIQKIEG